MDKIQYLSTIPYSYALAPAEKFEKKIAMRAHHRLPVDESEVDESETDDDYEGKP